MVTTLPNKINDFDLEAPNPGFEAEKRLAHKAKKIRGLLIFFYTIMV